MAMNLPAAGGEDQAVSAINTTPLVDVMLVLLIIFLITIPVVNFSVPVALPKLRNQVRESQPKDIVISVDAKGATFWFDSRVAGDAALADKLKAVSLQDPQPEIHIRGDARSDYAPVGRVLYACQRAGIRHVGFITEPPPKG
ncbi:MAG: biopolymer transporter ExbD [Pseudomonadota bacterium]|nr:biopolymer transporter ExbD [Pseudomonadota bacterium]